MEVLPPATEATEPPSTPNQHPSAAPATKELPVHQDLEVHQETTAKTARKEKTERTVAMPNSSQPNHQNLASSVHLDLSDLWEAWDPRDHQDQRDLQENHPRTEFQVKTEWLDNQDLSADQDVME